MRTIALALVFAFGCASAPAPLPPTVPVDRRSEEVALPPDPKDTKIPDAENWQIPLEVGNCAEKPGIFISEAKAERCRLYKIRYDELRTNYVADRSAWKAQRELYETRLVLADTEIQKLQPGWFQRHGFYVGGTLGFVLGVVTVISIEQGLK